MEKKQITLCMVVLTSWSLPIVWVLGKSNFSQLQNKVLPNVQFCSSLSRTTNMLSIPNSLNTGTIVFIEAQRVSLLQMSLIRQTTKQTEEPSTDSVFGRERQTTKLFMFLNC